MKLISLKGVHSLFFGFCFVFLLEGGGKFCLCLLEVRVGGDELERMYFKKQYLVIVWWSVRGLIYWKSVA